MDLSIEVFGKRFQNPVMLASGTCGYGSEMAAYLDLEALGGFVLKGLTLEPRTGNPAPRVAEFAAGMMNSVGLANVGLAALKAEKLPWLADNVHRAHVFVNVAAKTVDEFAHIVAALENESGFTGFELNVSCPNVKEGGAYFSSRADLLAQAVSAARAQTRRPLVVKLAPNVPDIAAIAEVAADSGADALTLINTVPGLLFDVLSQRPSRSWAGCWAPAAAVSADPPSCRLVCTRCFRRDVALRFRS